MFERVGSLSLLVVVVVAWIGKTTVKVAPWFAPGLSARMVASMAFNNLGARYLRAQVPPSPKPAKSAPGGGGGFLIRAIRLTKIVRT